MKIPSLGATKSLPPTFNGFDLGDQTIEEQVNNNKSKVDIGATEYGQARAAKHAADMATDAAGTATDASDIATDKTNAATNETRPEDATSDATACDDVRIDPSLLINNNDIKSASEAKQEVADVEEVKLEWDEPDPASPEADDQDERASHSSTPSSMSSTSPLPPPLPTSSPPPLD